MDVDKWELTDFAPTLTLQIFIALYNAMCALHCLFVSAHKHVSKHPHYPCTIHHYVYLASYNTIIELKICKIGAMVHGMRNCAHDCTLLLAGMLQGHGFDVKISQDAGLFLCNFIFYHSLNWCATRTSQALHALFVHVPMFEHIAMEQQLQFILAVINSLTLMLSTATSRLELVGIPLAQTSA